MTLNDIGSLDKKLNFYIRLLAGGLVQWVVFAFNIILSRIAPIHTVNLAINRSM